MKNSLSILIGTLLITGMSAAWSGELYRVDVSTTLTVRAEPSSSGKSVGNLSANAKVEVQDWVGNTVTIGGRSGKWAEIAYNNGSAYVFGGFLKAAGSGSNANAGNTNPHAKILATLQEKYPDYYANGLFLVDESDQRMYWYKDDELVRSYSISTSAKGLGQDAEGETTPSGAHRISTKIGRNAPRGTIFEKLANTGKIAKIYTKPEYSQTALVLTRIMRLDGLEPGKNKGGRVDTFNRMIYFHGTNKEGNLGKKASHGCIRMKNDEIMDLFNRVSVDTLVYIQK